jgi:hypothetical protein
MGNFIGGLLIVIVLVCLMFGVLVGAGRHGTSSRRRRTHLRIVPAPRPTFGHWQAPTPRPQAHPYQDNLKKNQGGWRWQ